jgi:hypothetical protein
MTTAKTPETEAIKVEVKPHAPHAGVTVTEVEKKKKKRRYSRGLGTLQHLVRGVSRSAETVTEGVARVFSEYNERSDKSSRRKRDGALRDGIENWTKALSKGIQIAGDAPYKFVKEINRGPGSKQVRDTVRLLTPPPLR